MSPACEFQNGALCHNGAVTLGLGLQTGKRFSRFPALLSSLACLLMCALVPRPSARIYLLPTLHSLIGPSPSSENPAACEHCPTPPEQSSPLAPPFSGSVFATRLKHPNLSKCSQHRRISASHVSVSPQKDGARQILDPLSMALCPTTKN